MRDDDSKNEHNLSQTINVEVQPQVLIPFDVFQAKYLKIKIFLSQILTNLEALI